MKNNTDIKNSKFLKSIQKLTQKEFWLNVGRYLKERWAILTACGFVALIAAIFGGFLANKSMSPAEGWYTYYAQLINEKHQIPYVDFELLFPPLYVYCIAFFTKIFGYEILALRVLGVFIYIALSVIACLIFYKLFGNELVSAALGIVVFAYLQSEIVQISYDYIRFMDVSVYASVLAFICHIKKKNTHTGKVTFKNSVRPRLIAASVFAVFASLFKQSSGLLFVLFMGVTLVFFFLIAKDKEVKKQALFDLVWFAIVVVAIYLIMFFVLLCQGALGKYFYYNFKAASQSKGGVFTILFGKLFESLPAAFLSLELSVLAILLFITVVVEVAISKLFKADEEIRENKLFKIISLSLFGVLTAIGVILIFANQFFAMSASEKYVGNMFFWAFIVDFLILVLSIVCMFLKKQKLFQNQQQTQAVFFLAGVGFVLAYGVSMSGGFAQSQLALCVGLSFGCVPYFARSLSKQVISILIAGVLSLSTVTCFALKVKTIYSWWGMDVGTYWEQTEKLDLPCLNGIYVSKTYAEMYRNVYNAVVENVKDNDNVFVFPHAPIFYTMTGTDSKTFTKLQWFDVSVDKDVIADLEVLKQTKPNVIVYINVPQWVIDGHESAFREGQKSGLTIMKEGILELVENENYTQALEKQWISDDYWVTVYVRGE